jgi:hypothetical protein
VATITVNILANALPINGQGTGEISDRFLVYFVPAGYVFAIWGVIYLGLIAFTIYQALPAQRASLRLGRMRPFYFLGCLANSAWIFAWHYNRFEISLALMVILLLSLIGSYLQLGIHYASPASFERWVVDLPISIYLGWISVATIANVTNVLYIQGWDGSPLSPQAWAILMLAVAVVLGFIVSLTRRDIPYLLVFIWAFAGIAVKFSDGASPLQSAAVTTAGWIAVVLVAAALIIGWLRGGSSRQVSVAR